MRLHPSASALESEVEAYLQRLGRVTPDSTHVSHKSTLTQFLDWYASQRNQRLDETSIVAYATEQISNEHITTTRGRVDTLSNFLGYRWQDDPDLVKLRVATLLANRWPQLADLVRPAEPLEIPAEAAKSLLQYLRQKQFGTRAHAFTELLLDTKSRPEIIRKCDTKDFDREVGTINVGVAATHIVTDASLSIVRTVILREMTAEAVSEYLNYERPSVEDAATSPLFATPYGRMSESTLRRSIKDASDDATTAFNHQDTEAGSGCQLTPTDLWAYALHNNPDNQ